MTFGGDTAESYYDEGVTAAMKGDLNAAIQHFEQCIRKDNTYFQAYHQLGRCYYRLGKFKRAVKYIGQVVALKPKVLAARVDLGFAFLGLGETAHARTCFQDVAAARPETARAHYGLALCAFEEGQWDAAMELAQQAINVGGAKFGAFLLLGRAAAAAGRHDVADLSLRRAEELMNKAVETNPDAPEGYYLRGEALFAQGQYMKALENYRAAEDRAQKDRHYQAYDEHFSLVDMIGRRGLCLEHLGKAEAAREAGAQMLKLDPESKMGRRLAGETDP
jgi:tetratricopeptide (TPR) repeat protein